MNKITSHKQAVIQRFGERASQYDRHANLQKIVAAHLARSLPPLQTPDILEIGCGTGLFTRHLLDTYPGANLFITDLSQAMLDQCETRLGSAQNVEYGIMDGEHAGKTRRYDLIATSMTAQWFDKPDESLEQLRALLKPRGHLIYATTGPELFPQWRTVLQELSLPCGLAEIPPLPGVMERRFYPMRFENGIDFLESLRATGASTPRKGYSALSPGALRRAIRLFERQMKTSADWHILYGHLRG